MIAAMRSLALLLPVLLAPALLAQAVPVARTLHDVQRAFAEQRDRLYAGSAIPTREQELELLRRQTAELQAFVDHEAAGDDRWNGRLMLADLSLGLRDRPTAIAALRGLDPTVAPPLLLLTAADMAARLDQTELRDRLVDQALQRPAPLPERLAMARILMTLLREVARGDKIFADALAAATDDEQRALVRWHQCDAIREREDLPENSYFTALEQLAKDLPGTYHGSVAKDRCAASQFTIGAPANPFAVTTTEGTRVELQALKGRAVLLVFWSAGDAHGKAMVDHLQSLAKAHAADLLLLGVSIDPDPAEFRRACTALGATFLQVCDGRGWQAELALRYGVEAVPTLIAIDRNGAIAGLNLHVDTKDARDDLDTALQRALRAE